MFASWRGSVGVVKPTYRPGSLEEFMRLLADAGFEVLGMEGMDVPFDQVGRLSSREVYAHAKAAFRRHTHVDGVYMLGSGWRALDIVDMLEQDLEVPVLHAVPARVWAIQQHFLVRERRAGLGRLLAGLPPPSR